MKTPLLFGIPLLLSACAGAVPSDVRQFREAPTGLGEREAVSVVLLRYRGTDDADYADTLADEAEYFEDCLSEGLEEERVRAIPSATLPPALREALPVSEETFPIDQILGRIEAARDGDLWHGPRFLVVLEAGTKKSEPLEIVYVGKSGRGYDDIFGVTRIRTTDIKAYVFDSATPRYLGRVESTSWGYVGAVFYCLLPCIPIPHTADTEKRACKDLAVDLAEFLRR